MNFGQIASLIQTQSDDATGAGFAAGELLSAVNEGQQFAALLTLCLEKTASFTLNGSCFYLPRPTLTDMLVPLRITLAGTRIRPATLADVEAENPAWQATAGTPARYVFDGFNLLAITPQGSGTASVTYAFSPAALTGNGSTPQIPEAFHQSLVDYGVYRVRLKEGAQGLERGLKRLNVFLDDMQRLGEYTRARSLAAYYDVQAFELALFDRSRMIDQILKGQAKWLAK